MNRSSYSTSPAPRNTSLKSPSPDQTRMNVLTPTKIKYITNTHTVNGFDQNNSIPNRYSSETQLSINNQNILLQDHSLKNFKVDIKLSSDEKQGKYDTYIQQLERRVHILSVENKNLVKKLDKQNPRKNTYVIERIKQQYEEKIATMKLMVEQQIKQAIGIIEDTCQALTDQMNSLNEKIDIIENKMHEIKVRRIMVMEKEEQGKNQIDNFLQNTLKSSKYQDNSISDIIGLSIPEQEQWQESKNYTITISKLEEEIEKMKQTIEQTDKVYHLEVKQLKKKIQNQDCQLQQKQGKLKTFKSQIEQKNQIIRQLQQKLGRSERSSQHSHNSHKFTKQIKQQLHMLYKNVNQMAKDLQESQKQYSEVILKLQEKNQEVETVTREIMILRDKVIDHEQNRMLLDEKNKFLQGNIEILERELKERKNLLEQALANRAIHEKERLLQCHKKENSVSKIEHVHNSSGSFLELTSRIDKLLQLQEEREKQFSYNSSGNNSEYRNNSSHRNNSSI